MYKRLGTLLFVLIAVTACGAPTPTAATVTPPAATAVRIAPTDAPAPTNTARPANTPTATAVPALAEFMIPEGFWTMGKADAKVLFVDSSDFL